MGTDGRIDPETELIRFERADSQFLDANLLIGFSVAWDGLNTASRGYFDAGSPNYYTSERVHDEARTVVEDCRRETLQVAVAVAEDFDVGQEYNLLDDIYDFILREFDDPKSPVQEYPQHRSDLFRTLAYGVSDTELDAILEEINSDFRKAQKVILLYRTRDVINIWEQTPPDPEPLYPEIAKQLDSIMTNSDDRDLLLDAQDIVIRGAPAELLVATMDRSDFIGDRAGLEETLEGVTILDVFGMKEALTATGDAHT